MSPTRPVTGDACRSLIATVVSFDWRFCASLLGVTFPSPPSTFALSSVTLTLGPTTAWLPSTLGTKTSVHAKSAETRTRGMRLLIASSLSLPGTRGSYQTLSALAVLGQRNPRRGRISREFRLGQRRPPPDP